jgi:signal peptidase I
MVLSWSGSRERRPLAAWWARWYGLAGLALAAIALAWPLTDLAQGYYQPFYVPAESMSPTLLKGDRFMASMRPWPIRRGDVVVIDVGPLRYVKRIAALPGDRIALKAGQVILNGQPVPQRLVRTETMGGSPGAARRLAERFPGEAGAHHIYDLGPDPRMDEMDEQRVAPGHVFVLGDNRDRSADSRVSRILDGVEQLPLEKVRGRVLFQTWNPDGTIARPLR